MAAHDLEGEPVITIGDIATVREEGETMDGEIGEVGGEDIFKESKAGNDGVWGGVGFTEAGVGDEVENSKDAGISIELSGVVAVEMGKAAGNLLGSGAHGAADREPESIANLAREIGLGAPDFEGIVEEDGGFDEFLGGDTLEGVMRPEIPGGAVGGQGGEEEEKLSNVVWHLGIGGEVIVIENIIEEFFEKLVEELRAVVKGPVEILFLVAAADVEDTAETLEGIGSAAVGGDRVGTEKVAEAETADAVGVALAEPVVVEIVEVVPVAGLLAEIEELLEIGVGDFDGAILM